MESNTHTYTNNPALLALKQQALKEADDLLNASDWTVKKEKDGLKQLDRSQKWHDLSVRGCEAEIVGRGNDVFRFQTEPELIIAGFSSQGKNCQEARVMEYVDQDCVVLREIMKPPFPVTARELVAIKCRKDLGNGQVLTVVKSIDYEGCPEEDKYIRALCHFMVYHMTEKGDGKMYVRSCGSMDPRGSIPDFLKAKMGKEHYKRVKMLGSILQHLREKNLLSQ